VLQSLPLVDPAYHVHPEWHVTFGDEVADLAASVGLTPDPEQKLALDMTFGVDRNGRSVAFESAVIAARQNLKTAFLQMCALGWLAITDQQLIVWSSHELDTTKEAHRDLSNLIENYPPLRRRLAPGRTNGIKSGNNEIIIEFRPSAECPNGQRIKFKARTQSGGRGLTGDRVVLDEAFGLQPAHMGSLMPTLSARPDPQLVYGSSACRPESAVLRKLVDRGRSLDPIVRKRLAYLEFCAPEDACEDPECTHDNGYPRYPGCAMDKREYIIMANPAAGRRITWEYLEGERDSLDPAEFGRERLGWHDKPAIEDGPLITRDGWMKLRDPNSMPTTRLAFGVYSNKLQTAASIGVAAYRADGKIHVGIIPAARGGQVGSKAGIDWIPARMVELRDSWKPVGWGIDDRSATGSLLPDLTKRGFTVGDEPGQIGNATAADVARACGDFYRKFNEDTLRHRGAKPLSDSVTAGKMRDLADAWAWDRKDIKSDIVQLMAVTLAVHALETAPPSTGVWSFYT
jgi:hypothetical protein